MRFAQSCCFQEVIICFSHFATLGTGRHDVTIAIFQNHMRVLAFDPTEKAAVNPVSNQMLDMFRQGYPRWREFAELRREWGADRVLHSLLSRRLEL